MKKLTILIILVLATCMPAFGQGVSYPPPGITNSTPRANGSAAQTGDIPVKQADTTWKAAAPSSPLVPGVDYQPAPVQIPYTSATPWTPTPAVGTTGAEIRFNCALVDHALVFGAPTGTPVNGQILTIRWKSDASPHALDFATATVFRPGIDIPLPTTTVANKTGYAQFAWNATDSLWDLVGAPQGY